MSALEVRVACQQLPVEVGQLERNRALTREAVREAVSAGARLVVLPELSNSGYVFESAEEARACAEPPDGRLPPGLVGGSRARRRGRRRRLLRAGRGRPALQLRRSRRRRRRPRRLPQAAPLGREQLVFEPGRDCAPVLETRIGRVGVAVCYDFNFPEVARGLALAGADIVVLPANFPGHPRPRASGPSR